MSFKVEYASERQEIWRWYWRTWRKEIWKIHMTMFLVVSGAVAFFLTRNAELSLSSVLVALVCGFLAVAWMPAYPILMFSSDKRSVEIDQDGISTTIGEDRFRRSWDDIRSISQEDGYVVLMGQKGSAFLIPPRAFQSEDEKQRFLSFALDALGASLTRPRLPPSTIL
jgi:hypothetical protein